MLEKMLTPEQFQQRTFTDDEFRELARDTATLLRQRVDMAAQPAYVTSYEGMLALLANFKNRPNLVEEARNNHRADQHDSESCEACGWFDAAVYQARTGRQLAHDFLDKPITPRNG